MSANNNADKLKKFIYKLGMIVAAAFVIFILVFVIANFQIVLIYIRISETLKSLIAIVIDFFF
jgi:hypothetical protein